MNRLMLLVLSVTVIASIALPALAQEPPRPPRPEGPRGAIGPDGRGTLTVGPGGPEMLRFELMRGYIDLVDRYSRLSRDPTSAGVAAVIGAADLLKHRGTDPAIEYFTKQLETVKNEAIRRAIRIQLAELYKQAGQHDRALEQLTELMNAAPPGMPQPPEE